MKEAELLGKLLPALPIIEEIRQKYNIDPFSIGDDKFGEYLLSDETIDWRAVRQDIHEWVYTFGAILLPPELAVYQKMIEENRNLPPDPVFTEPVTDKLREDVTKLYKSFVWLYDTFTRLNALPWQTAIENIFSTIENDIFEYLLTGETRDIPSDWISSVNVHQIFGQDVVIAMVGPYADPKVSTEELHNKLIETFGGDRPNITQGNLDTAPYLAMKLQNMKIKDIADEHIQRYRAEYPADPESDEYKAAKRHLEDNLKVNIQRLTKTIFEVFKEQEI